MSDNIILEKYDINKSYNGQKKFDCAHEIINNFVHKSLKKQIKEQYAVAYVLLDQDKEDKFIGFYTLSPYAITKDIFDTPLPASPKQIPVFRLIMLGVDKEYAGKGYGSRLLQHCLNKVAILSEEAGAKGLYLDAESGKHQWYRDRGFVDICSADPETDILPMFITTDTIRDALQ